MSGQQRLAGDLKIMLIDIAVHWIKALACVAVAVDVSVAVDISVAVATPSGLVVPVLRNCQDMGFADIEKVLYLDFTF